ncbi:Nn.00g020850.m01.CDS01 [Neocucurbitaria sp. VM-36]
MAMDILPQELINRIAYYLERYEGQSQLPVLQQQSRGSSKFPPYATLSRLWKEAIEMITFQSLRIQSDELDRFQAIVTGNRRKYVTSLSYKIVLPEYTEEACGRVESEDDQRLNNESFTQGIHELYTILRVWENEGVRTPLRLELPYGNAFSPTDLRLDNKSQLQLEISIRKRAKDIFEHRFEKSFLRLLQSGSLPTLSNMQTLNIRGNSSRKLAPTIGPYLTASLLNLKNISWEFGDCDSHPTSVRSVNRVEFAEALRLIRLQQHPTAEILFYHEVPFDQRTTGESLVPSGFSYDPFSAGLRTFSQNLTALILSAHVDSTLFWPSNHESEAVAPSWPFLRTLDVTFNMLAPSGEWYFTGQRPEDHEDDDPIEGVIGDDSSDSNYTNYREHGDPATINPLLAALSKAVEKMPVLEHFMLTSELGYGKGKFHISYYAPNRPADWGDESDDDLLVRRVYYEVGAVWKPDDEIMQGLRGVGREKFGEEVIERYLDSQY